jgi:GntR family transcriptional regulator
MVVSIMAIPKYKQIAQELGDRIIAGEYVPQQRMPSDYELANEFEVTRMTIRKSIDLLIKNNLLYRQENAGTYVMSDVSRGNSSGLKLSDEQNNDSNEPKILSGEQGLHSFSEVAKTKGKTTKTKVIGHKISKYDEELWKKLEASKNEKILCVDRVRYLGEEPMTHEKLWIRMKFLPNDLSVSDYSKSMFHFIEDKVKIAYSHQEFEATIADEQESELLSVSVGAPLFFVQSTTYSKTGVPVLFDESYYRGDKYRFQSTYIRE